MHRQIIHQALQQLLLGGGVYTFCTFFTCLRDNGSVTMWNVHDSRGVEMVLGSLTQGDYDASDGHDGSEDDPGGAQRVVVYRG